MGRRIAVPSEPRTWQGVVRYYIVQRGWDLKQLAYYLNISHTAMRRIISIPKNETTFGNKRFNPKIISQILNLLHVPKQIRREINLIAARQAGYEL